MTRADLERLRDAYASTSPVYLPLRDLGGVIEPEDLRSLLDNGLRLYGIDHAGEANVPAVEAHEFVDECVVHAYALELLEGPGGTGPVPSA